MLARGFSLFAFTGFFRDSFRESLDHIRDNPGLSRRIVRFSAVFNIFVLAALFPLYYPDALNLFTRLAVYTAVSFAGFTGWLLLYTGLIRGQDGRVLPGAGLANYLTMARLYLIVPVVVLFSHGFLVASLVVYAVLGLTDIADGVVARSRNERTEFGVVMDPLADVFSTAAVFAAFLAADLIPLWLFMALMLRYFMLIAGSFALFLATGPIRFRATIPGKIVGIIQGIGIIIVVWSVWRGNDWEADVAPVLFPVLGLVFAGIVISQGVLGYLHIRDFRRRGARR